MHPVRTKYCALTTRPIPITALLCLLLLSSSCEEALERVLTGKKVQLLSPAHTITTTDTNLVFYWEPMEGALRYQLQVVAPRFDSIARLGVDTTITGNQFNMVLPPDHYQWRVRALNEGSRSAYSDTFKLTIR